MERPVRHRHRRGPARAGFTLIELLVAILIIATLLALLLPAIAGAYRRAKEAQVSTEINNMATALASFKNTYGDFPPSRVLLAERGYNTVLNGTMTLLNDTTAVTSLTGKPSGGATATDMTIGQLATRSLAYMRKFWPRVDFMSDPAPGTTAATVGQFNDFNGDQKTNGFDLDGQNATGVYVLSGSECLAFFLGGIPIRESISDTTTPVTGMSGFGKSPKFPFVDSSFAPTNRTVPNYEFNNGRLVDLDGDGVPSYVDPLDVTPQNRREYAYFSAYGANAYDPNDVNGYGPLATWEFSEADSTVPVQGTFSVGFSPNSVVSPAPNPYTAGPPTTTTQAWINSNSFQIFSAGQDRLYGLGGAYKQNTTGGAGVLPDNAGVSRVTEYDNVTNFSGGRIQ